MHALPLNCYRPCQESAKDFAAPPYDVFDRESAKSYVEAHPKSFLAIDRPETSFGQEQNMYADVVYQKAAELLDKAIADKRLIEDAEPAYYVYELVQNGHAQTGIVSAVAVSDYLDGTILRHENTTRKKEEDRVRHISATRAQTGPIFLAYRQNCQLEALIQTIKQEKPIIAFIDDEGVLQRIWRTGDPETIKKLYNTFAKVDRAYIADGHHRAASAVRVCQNMGQTKGVTTNIADAKVHPAAYFLAVLFDMRELSILPYNRLVLDSLKKSTSELLLDIQAQGIQIEEQEVFVAPNKGHVSMYLDTRWYDLQLPKPTTDSKSAALDTQRLQDYVLSPLLDIQDPRESNRIRFIGGKTSAADLAMLADIQTMENITCKKGPAIAFYMHPTSMEELIAISDALELMPPKSTWFEPKLRSGLFIRRLS